MSVSRVGYVSLSVTDLDRAVSFYVDVVGLRLVHRDTGPTAYLQGRNGQDHHCLILNETDRPGLNHIGLKVTCASDLERASIGLKKRGFAVSAVEAGEVMGQGSGIRFAAPSGHDFLLYFHAEKIGYSSGMRNPRPQPIDFTASSLDHLVIGCEDPVGLSNFLHEVFGFYITERVNLPDGAPLALFLSCSNTMHDIAILNGPKGAFHHLAFGVESRADVIRMADRLKADEVPTLDYGVTRHGVAGVTTVYCHDPSKNRIEIFNGAYLAGGAQGLIPEVTWGPESYDRALFYYEGMPPESFAGFT